MYMWTCTCESNIYMQAHIHACMHQSRIIRSPGVDMNAHLDMRKHTLKSIPVRGNAAAAPAGTLHQRGTALASSGPPRPGRAGGPPGPRVDRRPCLPTRRRRSRQLRPRARRQEPSVGLGPGPAVVAEAPVEGRRVQRAAGAGRALAVQTAAAAAPGRAAQSAAVAAAGIAPWQGRVRQDAGGRCPGPAGRRQPKYLVVSRACRGQPAATSCGSRSAFLPSLCPLAPRKCVRPARAPRGTR